MSEYIERMKADHKELEVKIKELNAFIHSNELFKSLTDLEQVRMVKQSGFMESYRDILDARIWTHIDR